MRIQVKSLQGDEYSVDVQHDSLVKDIKRQISEKVSGLEVGEQKLIYKGTTLQDGNEISRYNMNDGCKVHLIIKRTSDFCRRLASLRSSSMPDDEALPGIINDAMDIANDRSQREASSDNHLRSIMTASPGSSSSVHSDLQSSVTPSASPANMSEAGSESRFEVILREQLGVHLSPDSVDRIMSNLHKELNDLDESSSSMDDLELLTKRNLNISND